MTFQLTNNAHSTLASGVSNVATTMVVATGEGALFPTPAGGDVFRATLVRASDSAIEVVEVTARTSDTMTVTRAQEGTTGLTLLAGDKFELRVTAAVLDAKAGKATANVWTAIQTFTNSMLKLLGSSTGKTTFTSANSSATDYTITVPAVTGTLATLAGTETLTNKTIDLTNNSVTMTLAQLNTAISDANVGSPGLVLLDYATPAAAANMDDFLSTFSSSYDNILIVGEGVGVAADDSLRMRVAVAGSADTGSNYYEGASYSAGNVTSSSTSLAVTGTTTTAGLGTNFSIRIMNVNATSGSKTIAIESTYQINATPGFSSRLTLSSYTAANAITGVRFYPSGGSNFKAQGVISVYGYNNT